MSSNPSLLSRLAAKIASNAAIVDEYLNSNNLPQLSFDQDGPPNPPIPEGEEKVAAARTTLIDASRELHILMMGPLETTKFMGHMEIYLVGVLQVLCHFEVPQNIPLDGEISFPELASKTGLSESILSRFLRMAAVNYYFVEPRPGFVAHTSWSKLLAADERMRACVWFRHTEILPTVSKMVEMVKRYPDSPEPQHSAYALAFGDTFFGYKEKHPEAMNKFGQFMEAASSGDVADSAESIAHAYEWDKLPASSLIVDVGGGMGHVSAAIAKAHPHLKFQIQDYANLTEQANALLKARSVSDRVEFTPHNFFNPQPPASRGAAIYFLRYIMHDWSDLYCRRILKPIVDALGPDSKIVICDRVLPPPNTLPKMQESIFRASDLTMFTLFNACERAYEDWEVLFESVDERLKISRVIGQPKMRKIRLIEVQLAG